MGKLLRFSIGCYVGVFLLTLSSTRRDPGLTLQDVFLFPLVPVGAVWVLWAVGVIGEDAAEVVRYSAERMIVALAREPLTEELPEPPRQIPVHARGQTHEMDLRPRGTDYRRQVIGFVIRGAQVGSYTYRALAGRALDGERVGFPLWQKITDEPDVFLKSRHGTSLRRPLAETVTRLADGLPLAHERTLRQAESCQPLFSRN